MAAGAGITIDHPVNYCDPDGRLATGFNTGFAGGSTDSNQSWAYNAGVVAGKIDRPIADAINHPIMDAIPIAGTSKMLTQSLTGIDFLGRPLPGGRTESIISAGMSMVPVAAIVKAGAAAGKAGTKALHNAANLGNRAPDFIVSPGGTAFPVPKGAVGPSPVRTGKGFEFVGGSGGHGFSNKTTEVRFMDPVTTGKYQYPTGYASYGNVVEQTIDPYTGQTISKSNPWWHIPTE